MAPILQRAIRDPDARGPRGSRPLSLRRPCRIGTLWNDSAVARRMDARRSAGGRGASRGGRAEARLPRRSAGALPGRECRRGARARDAQHRAVVGGGDALDWTTIQQDVTERAATSQKTRSVKVEARGRRDVFWDLKGRKGPPLAHRSPPSGGVPHRPGGPAFRPGHPRVRHHGLRRVTLQVWWLVAAWLAMTPIQILRVKREEKVLAEAFGAEYQEYRKRTWF